MLKEAVVEHCAPTLAGLKTGNIFTVSDGECDLYNEIRCLNKVLTKKGLRLIPIRHFKNKTLVYLFRPDRLDKDLKDPEAEGILREKGYPCENMACCINRLVKNLNENEGEFPHEIGLFLGYPPCDVKGFIESSCDGVKCVGCWKVYGNEKEAKKTFLKYDKCKTVYMSVLENGRPFEKLVVDTSLAAAR